jgi:hypothetical protein
MVLVGCWPKRMSAELAAVYCGEQSVKTFLKRVGSEYPQPVAKLEKTHCASMVELCR